jgi:hypothetical protein
VEGERVSHFESKRNEFAKMGQVTSKERSFVDLAAKGKAAAVGSE